MRVSKGIFSHTNTFSFSYMFTEVFTMFRYFSYINFRAKLGKLYLINATVEDWTISTYPNIVGEVSKPAKLVSVS